MSRFDSASSDYGNAIRLLRDFVRKHSDRRVFEPRRVARELGRIEMTALAYAFDALASDGLLVRVFRIRPPTTHTLLDQDFYSVDEIPAELRDAFNRPFCTDDAEIVQVFRNART